MQLCRVIAFFYLYINKTINSPMSSYLLCHLCDNLVAGKPLPKSRMCMLARRKLHLQMCASVLRTQLPAQRIDIANIFFSLESRHGQTKLSAFDVTSNIDEILIKHSIGPRFNGMHLCRGEYNKLDLWAI